MYSLVDPVEQTKYIEEGFSAVLECVSVRKEDQSNVTGGIQPTDKEYACKVVYCTFV